MVGTGQYSGLKGAQPIFPELQLRCMLMSKLFLLHCIRYLLVPLLHAFGLLLQREAQTLCPASQLCFQVFQGLSPCLLAAPVFPLLQHVQAIEGGSIKQ